MRIECPSCHLTGNINEGELPITGGRLECPRCKTGFPIDKPAPATANQGLMSMCPACQYSTFTDEMFSVCPKCGATASNYRELLVKKPELKEQQPEVNVVSQGSPPPEPDPERRMREYIEMKRSLRNPDFENHEPGNEEAPGIPIPEPIKLTAWIAVVVGALSLCVALAGLVNYYGKDWQAILSVPFLEPESKVRIFFRFGFFPWVRLLFSICFILAATQFLARRPRVPKIVSGLSWGGIALILIQETAKLVNRILQTSGSPSLIFYLDCSITFLASTIFWSIPFLVVIVLLRRKNTLLDYPEK